MDYSTGKHNTVRSKLFSELQHYRPLADPQELLLTETPDTSSGELDQRFVLSGLALELFIAYLLFPVSFLDGSADLLAQGKLYVLIAQISLGLTATSLVLIILGLLHKRGLKPTCRRLIVGLSWLAIPGILFWTLAALDAVAIFAEGCDSITVWKCYFVQAALTSVTISFRPLQSRSSRLSGYLESELQLKPHANQP